MTDNNNNNNNTNNNNNNNNNRFCRQPNYFWSIGIIIITIIVTVFSVFVVQGDSFYEYLLKVWIQVTTIFRVVVFVVVIVNIFVVGVIVLLLLVNCF